MNEDIFTWKLTKYAHTLNYISTKYQIYSIRWNMVGHILSSLSILTYVLFNISYNWLFLILPILSVFYIRASIHKNKANRIFDMLKSAHNITSEETLDAMQSYVEERYGDKE